MSNAAASLMLAGITNAGAVKAYQSVDGGVAASQGSDGAFSAVLTRALDGAIASGNQADTQATQAIAGNGDLTQVVTAVSRAQLALQTTVAVRDRVIAAYQDIIKMPI
jgi:flagellar hook-basal body complex protein FliE